MNGREFTEEGANSGHTAFPALPLAMGSQEQDNGAVMISRDVLEDIQKQLQTLASATAASDQLVSEQAKVIDELVTWSVRAHRKLQNMEGWIAEIHEPPITTAAQPNGWYHDDTDGHEECAMGGTMTASAKKAREDQNNLLVQTGMVAQSPIPGLPTPLTKSANAPSADMPVPTLGFAHMPITPGRIGPNNNGKKAKTFSRKRKPQTLANILPPANVLVPVVPLTDTEVIVYFFQSMSRPNVALRLYSRNWGPRQIVDVINAHRNLGQEYLTNTCSVKCNGALKRGRITYGPEWEGAYRAIFKDANDLKATDLIRLAGDELDTAVDYQIRDMCIGIKNHPEEGVDGGLFTRCVKYCLATKAPYTLQNVWELAKDLQQGRVPVHPPSPAPRTPVTPYKRRGNRRQPNPDDEAEEMEPSSPVEDRRMARAARRRANRSATPDDMNEGYSAFTTMDAFTSDYPPMNGSALDESAIDESAMDAFDMNAFL